MFINFIRIPYKNKLKKLLKLNNVSDYSALNNIYHCCAHKTASQWVRTILSDPRVYRFSGLGCYNPERTAEGSVDERKLQDKTFQSPFPQKKIVSPFYVNFDNFTALPKPKEYKAFFVVRDPRDLITSYYFSIKHSHPDMANVKEMRDALHALSLSEGFLYVMDDLYDYGTFQAMRSWADGAENSSRVELVKFEDLSGPRSFETFQKLFIHCEIPIPEKTIRKLLQDHGFKRISKRVQGEEDITSHYRKGTPGDWVNYFNNAIEKKLRVLTGDLVEYLGYQ